MIARPQSDKLDPRRPRIDRLLAIARRVADPADPLGIEARERLRDTSGLSPEGIELALTHHLETSPSETEIAALLGSLSAHPGAHPATHSAAHTGGHPSASGGHPAAHSATRLVAPAHVGEARRCHVVIAANVCTSALRSIAVALTASASVLVRASSRDPVLAEILTRELSRDHAFLNAGASIALEPAVTPEPGDELHIYGSDQTIEALRAAAPPGVVVRGHGTGFGIAVVGQSIDLTLAARALADDVVPFDQRGCLSPRIALVEGPTHRAFAFQDALHEALASSPIPRGPLDDATLAELAIYRSSMEAIGRWLEGPSHAVGLDSAPRSLLLPPIARVVHVVAVNAANIASLLAPWARFIAALGLSDEGPLSEAVRAVIPLARCSKLGQMQRPPLDGPVDRRAP